MPSFHVRSTQHICQTRALPTTADQDFPSSNKKYLIIAYNHLKNCLWIEKNTHSKILTQLTKFATGRPLAIKGPGEETKLAKATILSKCV